MDKLLETLEKEQSDLVKCAVCKHYLSVPPILHHESIGSVCGRERCNEYAISRGAEHRQESLEAMFQSINFPCINKARGCNETASLREMKEHEEEYCEFQTLTKCPFSDSEHRCEEMGDFYEFYDHFKSEHSRHEFTSYIKKDLDIGSFMRSEVFFGYIQDDLVIVRFEVGKNYNASFKVWTKPALVGNLKYRIKVFNKEKKLLVAKKFKLADSFHVEIFKEKPDNTWYKIDINNINDSFEDASYLNIRFYVDGFEIDSDEENSPDSAMSVFDNIKCDKCKVPFESPIFVCENPEETHSICRVCHVETNSLCPMSSCSKKLFQHDFSDHRKTQCKALKFYMNILCKMCRICGKEVESVTTHLYNKHRVETKLGQWYTLKELKRLMFYYDGQIFYLTVDLVPSADAEANGDISFYVQCSDTNQIKYKYEIKFSNSESFSPALTFTGLCLPDIHPSLANEYPFKTLISEDLLLSFFSRFGGYKFAFNVAKI